MTLFGIQVCSVCSSNETKKGQRFCQPCRRWYRQRLPARPPTALERKKRNARRAVNWHVHRGTIVPGNCEICGTRENVEAHHPDYDQPLKVFWLCAVHHRFWHELQAANCSS